MPPAQRKATTKLAVVPASPPAAPPAPAPTEPTPDQAVRPGPPTWLAPDAQQVWARLAEHVDLEARDLDLFAVLCDTLVQYRQASHLVAQAGLLIKGNDGVPVRNPATVMARELGQQLHRLAREFGLTPGARGHAPPPEEEGPRDWFSQG